MNNKEIAHNILIQCAFEEKKEYSSNLEEISKKINIFLKELDKLPAALSYATLFEFSIHLTDLYKKCLEVASKQIKDNEKEERTMH